MFTNCVFQTSALDHAVAGHQSAEGAHRKLLEKLGKFDNPLRELEYCNYTFDLVMDQGAYAEFKRHRMMTQTPQRLTTRLGWPCCGATEAPSARGLT